MDSDPATVGISTQPLPASMEFLLRTIQQLSFARSMAELQHTISVAARKIANSDGATFVLRQNGQCYYAEEDSIAPLWKGRYFSLETCVSGWCMQHRQAVVIDDIRQDARIPQDVYACTYVRSMVMVPIRTLDPIGAIGIYWSRPYHASDSEVQLLQALANTASVALENIRVYDELEHRVQLRTAELEGALHQIQELSITDELTGLYNRRGFRLLVGRILQRLQRTQEPFVLAYLDLDGLKQINDACGHGVGDELIRDAAAVLRESLRESDVLARLGGDEFCVFAQGVHDGLKGMQRRIETAMHRFNQTTGKPYQLAFSLGIVEGPVRDATTLDQLIALADQRMYLDKQSKPGSRATALPSIG